MEHSNGFVRHTKWLYLLVALSMTGVGLIPIFIRTVFRGGGVFARVNGISISDREYRRAVQKEESLRRMVQERFGSSARSVLESIGHGGPVEHEALMALSEQKIFVGIAQAIPISISTQAAIQQLQKPQFLQGVLQEEVPQALYDSSGNLKRDLLQKYIQRSGLTMADFESMVDNALLQTLVIQLFRVPLRAPSWYVAEQLHREAASRVFELTTVSLPQLTESPDEGTVRQFWSDENRRAKRYWAPERRSGTLWSFELPAQSSSADQQSPADLFRAEANQVIMMGNAEVFDSYLKERHAKKVSLKKLSLGDASSDSNSDSNEVAETIFSIERIGERASTVAGNKGYIVELGEISPKEEIEYEYVAARVRSDLEQRERLSLGRALLKKDSGTSAASTRIELTPGITKQGEFERAGFALSQVRQLATVGLTLEAHTERTISRLRLVSVGQLDESLLARHKGKGVAEQSLRQGYEQFVLEDLIDSLKEHAIMTSVR